LTAAPEGRSTLARGGLGTALRGLVLLAQLPTSSCCLLTSFRILRPSIAACPVRRMSCRIQPSALNRTLKNSRNFHCSPMGEAAIKNACRCLRPSKKRRRG